MSELPAEAIQAATKSVTAAYGITRARASEGVIHYALAAAAPVIAKAERDRIRQLAVDRSAHYHQCGVPCLAEHSERPFADLLDGAP